MKIQIVGAGCEKCDKIYEATVEAVKELQLDAEIEKVEDLVEIVKMGIMTTPTIVIDGKVVSSGVVIKKDKIKKLLSK